MGGRVPPSVWLCHLGSLSSVSASGLISGCDIGTLDAQNLSQDSQQQLKKDDVLPVKLVQGPPQTKLNTITLLQCFARCQKLWEIFQYGVAGWSNRRPCRRGDDITQTSLHLPLLPSANNLP